jgi:hypothetical protein
MTLTWNRVFIVAGPIEDVEVFERAAAAGRLRSLRRSRDSVHAVPEHWRERPKFSLRPLLRLLAPAVRAQVGRELPNDKNPRVASRLETLDGRLRIEYWFAAAGPIATLERFCRQIVANQPSLAIVVAGVVPTVTRASARLITATGVDRYRLPSVRRLVHMRRATRKWGRDRVGRELALDYAADAMLQEVCCRWDNELAGSGRAKARVGFVSNESVFGRYLTHRSLVAAGPAAEVEWLIARARGGLQPHSTRNPWRSRPEISFGSLANLLPRNVRPTEIPPELANSYQDEIWACGNVLRARWSLTDDEWADDVAFEQLLVALSRRYRQLCLIACWEEPDTFEAGGSFFWRGRVVKHSLSRVDHERIVKAVYGRYGLAPDGDGDETTGVTADDDVDMALLEQAESHWDLRTLSTVKK